MGLQIYFEVVGSSSVVEPRQPETIGLKSTPPTVAWLYIPQCTSLVSNSQFWTRYLRSHDALIIISHKRKRQRSFTVIAQRCITAQRQDPPLHAEPKQQPIARSSIFLPTTAIATSSGSTWNESHDGGTAYRLPRIVWGVH